MLKKQGRNSRTDPVFICGKVYMHFCVVKKRRYYHLDRQLQLFEEVKKQLMISPHLHILVAKQALVDRLNCMLI